MKPLVIIFLIFVEYYILILVFEIERNVMKNVNAMLQEKIFHIQFREFLKLL